MDTCVGGGALPWVLVFGAGYCHGYYVGGRALPWVLLGAEHCCGYCWGRGTAMGTGVGGGALPGLLTDVVYIMLAAADHSVMKVGGAQS